MTKGLIFWVLMLLWLIFGLWSSWPIGVAFGGSLMLFILLGLVGWQCFGPPLKG